MGQSPHMAADATDTSPLATQVRCAEGQAAGTAMAPPAGCLVDLTYRAKDEPDG